MLTGLVVLLTCQLAGELAVTALGVPVPGAVVGMLLLLTWLLVRGRDVPGPVAAASDALLDRLGLLFVPSGVGVVQYGGLLAAAWLPVAVGLVGAWLLGLVVTGLLVQAVARVQAGRGPETRR